MCFGGSLPVFHKILIPFILPISRKLCYTLYQTTHRPGGTAMPAGTVRRRPYLDEQSERERQSRKRSSLAYWIVTIVFLVSGFLTPVGVIMLVIGLFGQKDRLRRSTTVKRHPADLQREGVSAEVQAAAAGTGKKAKKGKSGKSVPIPDGKTLILVGGILSAVFGLGAVSVVGDSLFWLPENPMWFLEDVLAILCFFGASLGVLGYGLKQRGMGRRFRKYLSLIGKREQVSLATISEVSGIRHHTVCDDLQEMLDRGILPVGYLDLMNDRLVLSDEGVPDPPAPEPAAEKPADLSREDAILKEIRQLNDDIANPQLSAQIDEIEEITGKIFRQLKEEPAKEPQLRSFLNYYLPTTLKILHAYAQLESQGIEGDNITAAKERIEGMMGKVVEGFEKQLDRLFEHDAMDITSDVAVLEKMLSKDGLSGDGLKLEL